MSFGLGGIFRRRRNHNSGLVEQPVIEICADIFICFLLLFSVLIDSFDAQAKVKARFVARCGSAIYAVSEHSWLEFDAEIICNALFWLVFLGQIQLFGWYCFGTTCLCLDGGSMLWLTALGRMIEFLKLVAVMEGLEVRATQWPSWVQLDWRSWKACSNGVELA